MSYSVVMGTMYIPTITFGDRLRRLRLDLHMTQGDLARAVNVSTATIGKYELLDEPTRTATHLAATIQLLYGVPREWLLTGTVPAQRAGIESREYQYGLAA